MKCASFFIIRCNCDIIYLSMYLIMYFNDVQWWSCMLRQLLSCSHCRSQAPPQLWQPVSHSLRLFQVKIWFQNRRMKLKKELRAVKEINEQVRREREEQDKLKQQQDEKKNNKEQQPSTGSSQPASATNASSSSSTSAGGGTGDTKAAT